MGTILASKRNGFTLLEVVAVIVIIALVMLPMARMLVQIFQSTVYSSDCINSSKAMSLIFQDIAQKIRRADNGSISFSSTSTLKKLTFTYINATPSGDKTNTVYCVYQLSNPSTAQAIFQRGIGTSANLTVDTFPAGLDAGVITNFNVSVTGSSPYTATVSLTPVVGDMLTITIKLLNYNQ
jgi:prepilin-type N-terminal cleavage/methylation domain-containing protein